MEELISELISLHSSTTLEEAGIFCILAAYASTYVIWKIMSERNKIFNFNEDSEGLF